MRPRVKPLVALALRRFLRTLGYRLDRLYPVDLDDATIRIIESVAPRSGYGPLAQMPPERFAALCSAVDYVVHHSIPGAIVECGVYRGASMMAAAYRLMMLDSAERELYLFDTFEGMPEPGDADVTITGLRARDRWNELWRTGGEGWCASSLAEVQANLEATGYDRALVHYVKGRVEDTLPAAAPEQIALLRLDTDWYASTRHELVHLFPRLSPGGILIVDDFGHWEGARKAVEEYFAEQRSPIFLARVDYSARIAVKQ